ncbi:MAG: hypothetical protein CFE45_39330, partial [Burkholderiales bacterium PBB5]
TRQMMTEPLTKERLVGDWYRNIHTGVRRTMAIARSSDPALATFFAEDQAASTKASGELQKQIEGLLRSDAERALFKDIATIRQTYIAARNELVDLKKAGKVDEALQILERRFAPPATQSLARMAALLAAERSELARNAEAGARDEVSALLAALSTMRTALSASIGEIRQSAESIEVASAEVATGNVDLSQRTEQTASNLHHTA